MGDRVVPPFFDGRAKFAVDFEHRNELTIYIDWPWPGTNVPMKVNVPVMFVALATTNLPLTTSPSGMITSTRLSALPAKRLKS